MRHEGAVLLTLLCGACSGLDDLSVDAPAEIRWLALVAIDDDGAFVGASEVRAWPVGSGVSVFARAEGRNLLIGWSDEDLGGAREAVQARGSTGSLVLAVGCAPALGAPSWQAEWRRDGTTSPTALPLPRLGAPWLADVCPSFADDALAVDVDCGPANPPCAVRLASRAACTVDLSLDACGLPSARAKVLPDGSVCFENEAPAQACSYHGWIVPADPPPMRVERHSVLDVPRDRLPDELRISAFLRPGHVGRGYLRELVPLEDRILVVSSEGFDDPCPGRAAAFGRLHHFDLDGALVSTSTAPACLDRAVADPVGAGFVGLHVTAGAWRLGRFEASGRLVSSEPVDPSGAPCRIAAESHQALDLEVLPENGRLVALFGHGELGVVGDCAPGTSQVVLFDGASLRPVARFEIPDARHVAVVPAGGDLLAVVSAATRRIAWLDLVEGPMGDTMVPYDGITAAGFLLDGIHPIGRDEILVSATRLGSIFSVRPVAEVLDRARPFPELGDPTVMADGLPGGEILVASLAPDRWVSFVQRWSATERRFVPPSLEVGQGVVSRARVDRLGRVWMILPWSAGLVRVEVAP